MNAQIKKGVWKVSAVLSAFCVLVALNLLVLNIWRNSTATECGSSTKVFINPRFSCGHKDVISKKEYSELKIKLNEYIEEKKKEGKITDIGIWFRDLEAGPTFGINEREDFIPASLLKLPLAMAFLELSETRPELLTAKITYGDIAEGVPSQIFAPQDAVQKGGTYTVDDLIKRSIIYSDNVAAQLLYEYLLRYSPASLLDTYRNLGILPPGANLDALAVNTKEYGSIFRMLYNVSFLNTEMSEKILTLLVGSDFKNGLQQGIPSDVKLANKFGERSRENGEKQLHDCGIIYYPGNPYQLCVMTRGNDYGELKEVIGVISRLIYEEVDSRRIQ